MDHLIGHIIRERLKNLKLRLRTRLSWTWEGLYTCRWGFLHLAGIPYYEVAFAHYPSENSDNLTLHYPSENSDDLTPHFVKHGDLKRAQHRGVVLHREHGQFLVYVVLPMETVFVREDT